MAPVHVALVGDAQVGKTSLVLAAAQKPARDDAPTPVLLPTRLDLEWEGYRATCVCHDTSSTSQEDAVATIRKCDVALICFAMDKPSTMRSALRTWLPLVNSAHDQIAVMFVGCKRDISVMEPGHPAVRSTWTSTSLRDGRQAAAPGIRPSCRSTNICITSTPPSPPRGRACRTWSAA